MILYMHSFFSLVNSSPLLGITLKKGNIMTKHVSDLFPNGNTVDRVVMSGKGLLQAFFASIAPHKNVPHKHNANQHSSNQKHTHLQVSGIKVTFDNNPKSPRVESIKTACKIQKECSPIKINKWCQLNVSRNYTIALSSEFAGKNGTGVGIFSGLILDREVGDLDWEVFSNYVKECSPMKQELSGRIVNHVSMEMM